VEKIVTVANQQGIKGRVLDIGCAVGRSTIELAKVFESVVALDYSEKFINVAKKIQS
jgi:2-polyprenyl-3-methyl-5-hydroxy-6-metoxy-1,4-benzoquinol methylase